MKIFEALGYDAKGQEKLGEHIDEVLSFVDPDRINEKYRDALKKNDRKTAVDALAEYYRARPEYDMPDFSAGKYNKQHADNGTLGKMREINIDYTFEDGKINFLYNPTLENPPVNHEWLWQLNRHGWWGSMARAYADTKDEIYAKAFNAQMLDWVVQTDIPEKWNAAGSAFRTIECGLRLMGSWQTAFNLFRRSKSFTNEAIVVMLGSMHKQAVHLKNNPTKGNWLLMETSGIYNFGALFSEFKDAKEFRILATNTILAEVEKQILPDGLQYELSPDYHSVSLGCVEKIYKTAIAVGKEGEFPENYRDCMYRMAMAAVKLSTPGFTQPRTNDCYTMFTRWYTEFVGKIFPDEPVFKFVNSGRKEGAPPEGETASVFLPWSGFVGMRSGWGSDAAYLCFDVGPLGMAHIHQDKLNINLFRAGEELIFDDGGGQYEKSPERNYALSAYDHNTVTVDGLGQNRNEPKRVESEIDAGFVSNNEFDYAYGIYDDEFGDGKKCAVHKREVRFCKPDFFVVRDTLTSSDGEGHTYGLRFHMDTTTVKETGGAVIAEYGKVWDLLIVPITDEGESSGKFHAYSGQKDPVLGWYIGRNAERNHPATTIIMESAPAKVHHFTTLLIPFKHGAELPTVEKLSEDLISVKTDGKIYETRLKELNK